MASEVWVSRFAPSPSGHLHLGNARTAFLNYLAARHTGGRFILRIEDTDESRSNEDYVRSLMDDLRWLGISWDEGPDVGGPQPSYRQRDRRAIYEEWLAKLDALGLTYPCFCTPAELSLARKLQLARGQPPRYAGTCAKLTESQRAEKLASGQLAALRFRVPPGRVVTFVDLVHGEQRFNTDDIGDFIIRRTDGSSAFFFSNAIDDALMGVNLVLRGDDHLTNTPRQLLVLEALQLPQPRYAHVALLLGMDGAPLSKRHGALSLQDLRQRGFLPEAIRNHLVRLGHTCVSDGWLEDADIVREFDMNRLGRAAAKFDEAQLLHWQKEAVARLPLERIEVWLADHLPAELQGPERSAFVRAVRHNVVFPSDVRQWVEVVFGQTLRYEESALESIRTAGESFFAAAQDVFSAEGEFKQKVKTLGARTARKGPSLYMPLRAALTGLTHGPELGPIVELLGAERILQRIEQARSLVNT
jgi:glutamyl-tRNA synthetase